MNPNMVGNGVSTVTVSSAETDIELHFQASDLDGSIGNLGMGNARRILDQREVQVLIPIHKRGGLVKGQINVYICVWRILCERRKRHDSAQCKQGRAYGSRRVSTQDHSRSHRRRDPLGPVL